MKRGKIHWITQNIKVGIETRKLIRYPLFMLQLDALTVKRRRIFFFGAASFLHETFRETEIDGGINDLVILVGGDPAVDFWVVRAPVKRRVLAHDTDEILVFREVLFDPVQEPDRIILCPRKDHMADDDAAVQHGRALLIPGKSAGEADHFFYRGGSFLKIVRSGRVFF